MTSLWCLKPSSIQLGVLCPVDSAAPKFAGLYGKAIPELFKEDAADYKKNFSPQDKEFKDEWLVRTCELIDMYNPDWVWFDFGISPKRGLTPSENKFKEHFGLWPVTATTTSPPESVHQ